MTLPPFKSLGSNSQYTYSIKPPIFQRQGHTKQVFNALSLRFNDSCPSLKSLLKTETHTTEIESIQTLETEVEGILYDLVEVRRHHLHLPKQDEADKAEDQKHLQQIEAEVAPENKRSFNKMLEIARKHVGYLDKIIPWYEDLLRNIEDRLYELIEVLEKDGPTKHP